MHLSALTNRAGPIRQFRDFTLEVSVFFTAQLRDRAQPDDYMVRNIWCGFCTLRLLHSTSPCAVLSVIGKQDVGIRRDALNYRRPIRSFARLVLGGILLGALHATAASASSGVIGAPVVSYLSDYGISFSTSYPLIQPGVYAYPDYVTTVSGPNFFNPAGMATLFTYNLGFSTPLDSFAFTRPGLGSATMAAWTATAYSAADTALGSVSESLLFSYTPAATFTLTGPGIDHVQFSSDAYNFAGLNLSVDNLVLATSVPEPPTWPLLLMGLFGLGACHHVSRRKTQRI